MLVVSVLQIIYQQVGNTLIPSNSLVFDNYKCSIEVNGKTIYLELWDTSGRVASPYEQNSSV